MKNAAFNDREISDVTKTTTGYPEVFRANCANTQGGSLFVFHAVLWLDKHLEIRKLGKAQLG